MSQGLRSGVHRPRPWGAGLVRSTFMLVAVAALSAALWVAGARQIAAPLADAGRPVTAAQVVSCPSGQGLCAAPAAQTGAPLPLTVTGPFGPVPGDTVTITLADGAATLAGGHAWFNLTLTLVLAAVLTGWSVRWLRRVLVAATPAGAADGHERHPVRREAHRADNDGDTDAEPGAAGRRAA